VQTTAVSNAVSVLDNPVRPYAWGSRTAIPELLGVPPSGQPQAELWMGAHQAGPSTAVSGGRPGSLLARIEADPVAELGEDVAAEFGPRLPFLLKVIAADAPLSMQAHPDAARAVEGFVEENARGIPLDAPERNYRDTSHKPELLVALGPIDALCGFRAVPETVRLLDALVSCAAEAPARSLEAKAATAMRPHLAALRTRPDQDGLREVVTGLLTLPAERRSGLVSAVAAACRRCAGLAGESAGASGVGGTFAAELRTAAELADAYPDDVGVVTALLLNLVHLEPGEAIFLPPGNLHAYLRGFAVEIMANSDNVLRLGLTPKHVDVPELLRVLDVVAGPVWMPRPRPAGPGGSDRTAASGPVGGSGGSGPVGGSGGSAESVEEVYRAPVREFRLSRLRLVDPAPIRLDAGGPQILLVVDGEITVTATDAAGHAGRPVRLLRGGSAWVPAGAALRVAGTGTAFRATTNLR
jgi:mannose-6-phosphate isomerase